MTIRPVRPGGSHSGSGPDNSAEIMDAMPVNQVFVKNTLGKLVGIGIRQLADGTVLAPNNFGVESGSINFGDLITVSEAAGYLGLWNHLEDKQYQILDYYVPRNSASSRPNYFHLIEGEYRFDGLTDESKVITTNPLKFNYTTQLNARTNSIILTASSPMKNVRIRISKGNVTLKYLPTKAAYLGQETGYDFQAGENILDFGDSPVPLSAGTTLDYEIIADNISLKGSSSNLPKMSAYVQKGEYVSVLSSHDVSVVAKTGDYNDLINTPSPQEIDYPVSSVNAKTGAVVLNAEDIGAAEKDHTHVVKDIQGLQESLDSKMDVGQTLSYNDLADLPEIPDPQVQSDWSQTNQTSVSFIKNKPNLFSGNYADLTGKPSLFSGSYSDLTDKPTIPAAQIPSDWNATTGVSRILNKPVLFSGSYADLTGKPTLFSGNYNDLTNKPTIPVVNYPVTSVNSKTGAVVLTASDLGAAATVHSHSISEITGLQSALDGKISTGATIPYSSLSGTPTIPAAQIQANWTQTNTSALDYIKNKPVLFSGSYADLTNKPVFATVATSGAYADLTGKPVIPTATSQLTNDSGYITSVPVSSVNSKTGAVTLAATDVGAAPSAQGTKYYRQAGTQVTGVKVKYYTVTADSAGAWTLSLGSDFTEVLDVQATALSTSSTITGIRQATVNTYTSTSTTLSGGVFTNSVLVTVLISGTNSLAMVPSATVKVRVEGVGT